MLGRAVEENILRGESLGARGEKLEFTYHFDGAALLAPPLKQGAQRLRLARKPVANGQMSEVRV